MAVPEKFKSMFDYVFVDLDDTIFNTRQFKADIFKILSVFGVKEDDFNLSYKTAAEAPMFGYYDYTFEKQLEALRQMGYVLDDKIIITLNSLFNNNYAVSDAEDFLQFLQCKAKEIILLTAGNHFFQDKKIRNTYLLKYFDRMKIIDGGKDLILERINLDKNKVLFVNDNLEENKIITQKFPQVLVLSQVNTTYWTVDDYKNAGLNYFENLKSMKEFLNKYQNKC